MDWSTMMDLLDTGADIDVQDKDGWTLLTWAVYNHSFNWCTELLERGVNLHVRSPRGWTVWDYNNDTPYYSLFLQYGADVNQYSPGGWTALHRVCAHDQHHTITLLLAQGADPRLPVLDGDYKGQTAYDWGSFWDTPEGVRERLRWDTVSIQEVFIVASELGIVPIPSYLW